MRTKQEGGAPTYTAVCTRDYGLEALGLSGMLTIRKSRVCATFPMHLPAVS